MKIGDRVVLKTTCIGWDGKPQRARHNHPYEPKEIKRMKTDPMTVVEVSKNPDSVYIDCESYLGRKMTQKHGHMWFLTSDLDKV